MGRDARVSSERSPAPGGGPGVRAWRTLSDGIEPLVCAPGDDDEARRRKVLFTLTALLVVPAGLLWGLFLALAYDARVAAAIPLAYAVLTLADVALLTRLRRFPVFQRTQILLILALPAALQVAMGGFVAAGAVIVWSFIAVLMAVLFAAEREAWAWWAAFVATVVAAGLLEPGLDTPEGVPGWRVVLLFILNIAVVSSVAFAVLRTFMDDRRRLRELELAYLNQDLMLRQSEKLATLGTLAAGVAHELNNPAAATARGADRLRRLMGDLTSAGMDGAGDEGEARERIAELTAAHSGRLVSLSPLARSDREDEIGGWLRAMGLERPSEVATALVDMGLTRDELEAAVAGLGPGRRAALLTGVARAGAAERLVAEIGEGAARISQIVSAMRSYTNLDRAPVGAAADPAGIESTLVLLAGRLRDVVVARDYAADLPRIEANGGELNQVWTNIIENAVHAMGGAGTLTIRVAADGDDRVRVAIGDDGPGMPPEVAARVFDAFFTTKAPGEGTGLGLNISHNIVVGGHGGTMEVDTGPAGTTFTVTLPRRRRQPDGGQPSER